MADHENHEVLNSDCDECAEELDRLEKLYRPTRKGYDISGFMNREEVEDRELMRDEFHIR